MTRKMNVRSVCCHKQPTGRPLESFSEDVSILPFNERSFRALPRAQYILREIASNMKFIASVADIEKFHEYNSSRLCI